MHGPDQRAGKGRKRRAGELLQENEHENRSHRVQNDVCQMHLASNCPERLLLDRVGQDRQRMIVAEDRSNESGR